MDARGVVAPPRRPAVLVDKRADHPVVHVAYEDAEAYRRVGGHVAADRGRMGGRGPRRSGTGASTPGATSPNGPTNGWPTTGTATSRGARRRATAAPPRSAVSRPTATACSTWRATSGSGPPTGTPTPAQAIRCCEADSYDPRQPQFQVPPQGRQGRLVPVRRQLLPALPPGRPPTTTGRHRHEPHRLPLHQTSTLAPAKLYSTTHFSSRPVTSNSLAGLVGGAMGLSRPWGGKKSSSVPMPLQRALSHSVTYVAVATASIATYTRPGGSPVHCARQSDGRLAVVRQERRV